MFLANGLLGLQLRLTERWTKPQTLQLSSRGVCSEVSSTQVAGVTGPIARPYTFLQSMPEGRGFGPNHLSQRGRRFVMKVDSMDLLISYWKVGPVAFLSFNFDDGSPPVCISIETRAAPGSFEPGLSDFGWPVVG